RAEHRRRRARPGAAGGGGRGGVRRPSGPGGVAGLPRGGGDRVRLLVVLRRPAHHHRQRRRGAHAPRTAGRGGAGRRGARRAAVRADGRRRAAHARRHRGRLPPAARTGVRYARSMTAAFQASLLDVDDEAAPAPLGATVRRTALSRGAWIDLRPGWLRGADALFQRLLAAVPWRAERRHMYDRMVDVPRLLAFYDEGEPLPAPALDAARRALDAHYAAE